MNSDGVRDEGELAYEIGDRLSFGGVETANTYADAFFAVEYNGY